MQDDAICKRILRAKSTIYMDNPEVGVRNTNISPTYELLNVCTEFGILDMCYNMIQGGCHLSKSEWSNFIWNIAWNMEDKEYSDSKNDAIMYHVMEEPRFLTWWLMSDIIPSMVSTCEVMAKLVCDANLLKSSDYRLKKLSFSHKVCTACELGIREDIKHVVMQCPQYEGTRSEMCDVLKAINDPHVQEVLEEPLEFFPVIMGKHPANVPFESMFKIWMVSSQYITLMYRHAINARH